DNNNSDPVCYDTSGDTAATYCAALGIGGFNDWRMPTSKELEGIVDYSRRDPSIDPTFTNTSSDFYWSSTSIKGYEDYAWLVYFYHGLVHNGHKDGNDYVRCVRDGQ
ncbi:MAG: DUF1566 domain-containing protein, partial [Campylobacterota bacterium]|nr:DUF1566 domain-containing protein [Campylobacterota bacterium]